MNEPNTDILQVLTREGVLIHVSVRYPRFHRKLKPADLGLDPDRINDRLVSLGHKRLLPKEALAQLALVEGRTHALIDQSTFPFLGGIGHFLPNGKLAEVRDRLNELQRDFDQARDAFLREYAHHRLDALDEWRGLAHQLGLSSHEEDHLVSQVRESFPPEGILTGKFAFEIHLFQVAVPDSVTLDLVSFGEQSDLIQARREAASLAAQDIRSGVQQFVGECVTTLREQTAQLCEEMLASIQSGRTGGVHQKTLNRLVRFIDDFKSLNFANDRDMEAQLDRVREELLNRSASDYRGNASATRSLESGLSQLRDQARELATRDNRDLIERFGQLGQRKLQMAS